MSDSLLLTAARICTFTQRRPLTNASCFFFERDKRLFVVTSRHVLIDEASNHRPDRVEVELHTDPANLAKAAAFSIPLYREGKAIWKQGRDAGGLVDVAAIEVAPSALPKLSAYYAFSPDRLMNARDKVQIGTPLLIVGFPLGFHDTLHHMPVVRQAIIASSFGLRFQGQGYFLTDARTHRGSSGAPVVMQASGNAAKDDPIPWRLLGVHSSRLDVGTRDLNADEALGLNCAWYADILLTLTEN